MSNIIDYIKWRGDLDFSLSKFNEIDSAIMARFSYLPFDTIIKENEKVTIKELNKRFQFQQKQKKNLRILWPDDVYLFPEIGKSIRFGNLIATDYINIYDPEKEKQFSAITVLLPNDVMYISLRGTDSTVVGWKEDFNMSFKCHIESQKSAKEYVEIMAKKNPNKKIIIGGHSKGGNLAIYCAMFASEEIKNRIIKIYNFDGPGFSEDIVKTNEYNSIINKAHSYIPNSSIIGRLMSHKEDYTILISNAKGIMQHDIYTWEVIGIKFVKAEKLSNQSDFIDKTLTDWLGEIEPKKREEIIDAVFDIIYKTDEETFKGIKENLFQSTKIMLKSYQDLDTETKKLALHAASVLIKVAKNNVSELEKGTVLFRNNKNKKI